MTSKDRMRWTPTITKRFLELCLEEKNEGITILNWEKHASTLSIQFGKLCEAKQCKNHYSDLKSKLTAWEALLNWTGIGYDDQTKMPKICNDDRWEAFVKTYPRCAYFKNKPLENVELLQSLFTGHRAVGHISQCPTMGASSYNQPKVVDDIDDLTLNDGEEGSGDSDEVQNDNALDNVASLNLKVNKQRVLGSVRVVKLKLTLKNWNFGLLRLKEPTKILVFQFPWSQLHHRLL